MSSRLAGVLPVLQTPFLDDDRVDWDCLAREIDWAFSLGVQGVCSAMVSEILRLTGAERNELTIKMVEYSRGRGAVISSVGAESVREAIQFAQVAADGGCQAVMAIPPTKTELDDEGLWSYYQAIADATDLPVIVQDASSYVGGGIPLSVCCRLLDQYGPARILFKPERNPVGPHLSALRDITAGRARMFDGSGGMFLIDAFRRGVVGTMPAVDLLDAIVALWRAMKDGDEETAYRVHFPVSALVAMQLPAGLDGFLAIEKYLLVRRGIFRNDRRRQPYDWSLDRETREEVDRLFDRLTASLAPSP